MKLNRLVGSHIENLKPYVPGKPIEELERELGIKNPIKLASNENPLGPSPRAAEAMRAAIGQNHLYPDGAAHKMREAIADFHGVPMEEVICGNGSNELLTLAVRTFCNYGTDQAAIARFSFAAYGIVSQAHNVGIQWAPMDEGFCYDLDALLDVMDETTKIVFVANPNNPTGTYIPAEKLRAFLKAVPEEVVVVVDEAYHEYVQAEDYESAETMRDLRERLMITRTMSKCYGLAGVRAGYGIAPREMIGLINRIREPFNANLLAQVAVPAALEDQDFVAHAVALNEEGRRVLEAGLKKLETQGVSWIPSQTNFLLVETPFDARALYEALLMEGVILRPMAGYGLPRHLRISLSGEADMNRCLESLEKVLTRFEEEAR